MGEYNKMNTIQKKKQFDNNYINVLKTSHYNYNSPLLVNLWNNFSRQCSRAPSRDCLVCASANPVHLSKHVHNHLNLLSIFTDQVMTHPFPLGNWRAKETELINEMIALCPSLLCLSASTVINCSFYKLLAFF